MEFDLPLIGILGHAGSGKDTAAQYLVEEYNFQQLSMADPLKRFCMEVFGFSKTQLWGPSQHRDEVDNRYSSVISPAWKTASSKLSMNGLPWIAEVLGRDEEHRDCLRAYTDLRSWFSWLLVSYKDNLSPRVALQSLGTEWGRESVHADIWVNHLLDTVKYLTTIPLAQYKRGLGVGCGPSDLSKSGFVVSDVRFANELGAITDFGGKIVKISRDETDRAASTVGISSHKSEQEMNSFSDDQFFRKIKNDGTLSDLYANISEMMDHV